MVEYASLFHPTFWYMDEQTFEDYKSKYLDIYERTQKRKENEDAPIIEEVDFELELIQRDKINVAYILRLLAEVHQTSDKASQTNQQKR